MKLYLIKKEIKGGVVLKFLWFKLEQVYILKNDSLSLASASVYYRIKIYIKDSFSQGSYQSN
jgi:hypothetical protein